jgi:toxin ParE1/3/4
MIVRYRQQALTDLDEIFNYLNSRSPRGARNVLTAISAAIDDIAQNPLAARQTSDPIVRVKVVRRYLYKVFYTPNADEIEILHIRRGARRPWARE